MRRAAATAALGLGLLAAGIVFDARPLLATGPALVVAALAASTWVLLAAHGASVTRELSSHRVAEEEALRIRLTVRAGVAVAPSAEVEEPLVALPVPVPAGRRSARVRIDVRFARRGMRVLAPPVLHVRDPLGLARRTVRAVPGAAESVLVVPRVEPVVMHAAPGGEEHSVGALLASAAEVDIDGLRPYRPGAPASRIHWPAVARGAGLLERRLRAESESRPLLVLDTRGEEAEVDAAVRAAASLCLHLARAGGCSILLPGDRQPTPVGAAAGAWPRVHARLASVRVGAAPVSTALGRRASRLFVIAARAGDYARGAGTPRGIPAMLVVAEPLAGRRVLFEVAGCRGYLLAPARRREAAA